MALKQIGNRTYSGETADKPATLPPGSYFIDEEAGILYISLDDNSLKNITSNVRAYFGDSGATQDAWVGNNLGNALFWFDTNDDNIYFYNYGDSDWKRICTITDLLEGIQNPILSTYSFSNLPSTPSVGQKAFISDADSPSFLSVAVGGGAIMSPVFYNGIDWIIG